MPGPGRPHPDDDPEVARAQISPPKGDERRRERENARELALRVRPGRMRDVAHLRLHGTPLEWSG